MAVQRRTVVILNPAAGRGRGIRKWQRVAPLFADAHVVETEQPGDAEWLAREASESAHVVVAAGGDGTISEVANGLVGTQAHLGILPLGTGNDLARTLGIGLDIHRAADIVLSGTPRAIDLYRWTSGSRTGYGINVAGCGFDATVAHRINTGYRRLGGTAAYLAAVVDCLWRYRPVPLQLRVDEQTHEATGMLVAIGNGQSYGGGMRVAPLAQVDDGELDVVMVEGMGRAEFLRNSPRVFRGTHLSHPRVRHYRSRHVEVNGPDGTPVLVDGELVGTLPLRIDVMPAAMTIVAANP